MFTFIKYAIISLFSYISYPNGDEEEAEKCRERFQNYRKGHGYIDHDQLQDTKGIFIDCIRVSDRGGVSRSNRAAFRLMKTPEIIEMQRRATQIVKNNKGSYPG